MTGSAESFDDVADGGPGETLPPAPPTADDFAHATLGCVRLRRGALSDAETALIEALRLDPERSFAWTTYARTTLLAGDLPKAERLVRRALRLDPEDADAQALLSEVLAAAKQRPAATGAARRSAELAPDDADAHYALGRSLFETGRPFAARARLREAARLAPDDDANVEAFLEADRACRPVGLPFYWFTMLEDRTPGGVVGVWIGALAIGTGLRAAGFPTASGRFLIGYLLLCVCTWIARPLTAAWVRAFKPKF